MENIKDKANLCLNCPARFCAENGCPVHTNIPEFISCVKSDEYEKAYNILMDNNIFSHICSIVCPQHEQCEGACIRQKMGSPTEIGKLEEFVNNWALENGIAYEKAKKESNGKKVAIVGSGPSSLECAYELLVEGYSVDIYEKESFAGGLLSYGIPDFRLTKDLVKEVVDRIEKNGAKFFFEKELGKDILLENLSKEYDAVYIGIGAPRSSKYKLSEETLGVIDAYDLIKKYYKGEKLEALGNVIVIGGGNVAMDCSRIALKMGAKSSKILYRRDKAHMPANPIELEGALSDGVEFHELVRVDSANLENGKMVSVNCVKTEIVNDKAQDKEPKEEFMVDADNVIFAIGMKPNKDFIASIGIETDEWGYIKVDEDGKTNLDNVYAGGDVIEYKYTVARAIASGKKAAKGIIKNIK